MRDKKMYNYYCNHKCMADESLCGIMKLRIICGRLATVATS